jgi:aminoglycoside phosphotransferase (APT) family kinase protein
MMHDDEAPTDASLVRRLLGAQFPQWVGLDIAPVAAPSSDNAMYRLGDRLAARLPRRPSAVRPMDKEHAWLPRLALSLPLPVPLPLAKGAPGEGYPFPWSVCRWLEGETPSGGNVTDPDDLAADLAAFIRALQAIDPREAPPPGGHNHFRGAPLAQWRNVIDERLGWLADLGDIGAVAAAWETDSQAPAWEGPPVWIHGDLSAGNLLVGAGRLSGVIDWSCLGAGDPACELQVAWSLFEPGARARFKAAMAVDTATWTRGRAWGLAIGVLNLSYYRDRSPRLADQGRAAIASVLVDRAREGQA